MFSLKKLILILIVIITGLTISTSVVLAASNTGGTGTGTSKYGDFMHVCPDGCSGPGETPANEGTGTDQKRYIRLQISIPGVSKYCTYTLPAVKSGTTTTYKCHYIESNLPEYIKKLYSFGIGVVAIIAVIMIMISGLQWIFAAGSSGKIQQAKSQITAAISGLVLALCSYVILNTINPQLTTLKMEPVKPINELIQGTYWCSDLPEGTKVQRVEQGWGWFIPGRARPVGDIDLNDQSAGPTICGDEYYIEVTPGSGERKCEQTEIKDGKEECVKYATCQGVWCARADNFCHTYGGVRPFCYSAQEMCEKQNEDKDITGELDGKTMTSRNSGCDEFDRILQTQQKGYTEKYVCGKRFDKSWIGYLGIEGGDECVMGKEITCESLGLDWERASCLESDACSGMKDEIRVSRDCLGGRVLGVLPAINTAMCIDLPARGGSGVNAICCRNTSTKVYRCVVN